MELFKGLGNKAGWRGTPQRSAEIKQAVGGETHQRSTEIKQAVGVGTHQGLQR